MSGRAWKYLLLGAILVGTVGMGATRAEGCLFHWRPRLFGWWYPCWRPAWYVGCDPCFSYYVWRPVYPAIRWPWRWCAGCCAWVDYPVCDVACCEVVVSSPISPPQPAAPSPTPAKPKPQAGGELPGPTEPGSLPPPGPSEAPAKPSLPEPGKQIKDLSLKADQGLLSLRVPAEARVFINGLQTRSAGTRRQYISSGLAEGKLYPYTVRVLIPSSADPLSRTSTERQWETRTKTVYLRAGQQVSLDFSAQTTEPIVAARSR